MNIWLFTEGVTLGIAIVGANFNDSSFPSAGRAAFYDSGALLVSSTGKYYDSTKSILRV